LKISRQRNEPGARDIEILEDSGQERALPHPNPKDSKMLVRGFLLREQL
jgi:hypothetical protein